jgi:hypothetical protein
MILHTRIADPEVRDLWSAGEMVGNREGRSSGQELWLANPTGGESMDVTLAYLKGKDAESEEAQEHANSSRLAPYA